MPPGPTNSNAALPSTMSGNAAKPTSGYKRPAPSTFGEPPRKLMKLYDIAEEDATDIDAMEVEEHTTQILNYQPIMNTASAAATHTSGQAGPSTIVSAIIPPPIPTHSTFPLLPWTPGPCRLPSVAPLRRSDHRRHISP
ncbi:hypothetical protein CALVIDRAFT_371005 [Calocera viscosa TUFC12733]|uniref:Uncharacterized protein n=1 Tax=Calocera viscosa (strain TUFC12733) TaxID=1330018 RepID=A0A167GVF2_CALVF|nr:hypothetical protein CALVIDRAFT_371005 [Calocera viscosa TUFC12733]